MVVLKEKFQAIEAMANQQPQAFMEMMKHFFETHAATIIDKALDARLNPGLCFYLMYFDFYLLLLVVVRFLEDTPARKRLRSGGGHNRNDASGLHSQCFAFGFYFACTSSC